MVGRLVRKELAQHLLDFRFITVFLLCALLSALSVYIGAQNYARQQKEYTATRESHRASLNTYIDRGNIFHLRGNGYRWTRGPEPLSPIVYGLSGKLGREVHIHYQRFPKLEASLFEEDPVYTLFGILDLAFIVKLVLSLCVLLFTYDAVCGEKETGTLRLYASFPVARSTLAISKLLGATLAVLVPFVFAFLLSASVMALFPNIHLKPDDWLRMAFLMGIFALYLTVFVAFGLWASALTHRRMTAFLMLLGLWTLWVFILPEIAVRAARLLVSVENPMEIQKQADTFFWETEQQRRSSFDEYFAQNPVENFDALPDAQKLARREEMRKIHEKWDKTYYPYVTRLREAQRNRMRRQQHLAAALSSLSPVGAFSFVSMDLARTGPVQYERLENTLGPYLAYLAEYFRTEFARRTGPVTHGIDLSGFTPFDYRESEPIGECLSRNILYLLNLVLLAILGFAGAYVAILRYDVR